MATWQFLVVLIPASWAEENSYSSSALYDEEGYDTECAWNGRQPESDFKDTLGEVLPPSKSWHEELLTWGNEKEHDIQVWYENETIDGIHIRLDLNQNLNEIIIKVVKAAHALNCALFFPELKLVAEANVFEMKNAIKNSNAAKFVSNPQEFINELSKKT
ncbi:hypothetical protein [Shewanella sp. ECSMB14102]|uniref:hypothetical protein n=1 Tax=Shewanella sp. ECSMB14102 TaxID=1579504 RepID=UPI00057AC386|nr:hypothetical protein [Shewanella sp. ECSMB14102]